MRLLAPVSVGDLLDRITILAIKSRYADGPALAHVDAERAALEETWAAAGLPQDLPERAALSAVNEALWDVEDQLRHHEARGDFGAEFVALARQVYHLNDWRAELKRAANLRLGSALVEEKVLPRYDRRD